MDDSIEKGGESQQSQQQRTQDMMNLSRQYKGAGNIPDEALSGIGYVRTVMPDGTFRLFPQERATELVETQEGIKDKERPFERFSIDLPVDELPYRFIPENQRGILTRRLLEAECAFYPDWEKIVEFWKYSFEGNIFPDSDSFNYDRLGNTWIDNVSGSFDNNKDPEIIIDEGRLQNLRTFAIDFMKFTSSSEGEIEGIDPLVFQRLFALPLSEIAQEDEYINSRRSILEKMGSVGNINTEITRDLYHEISRLEGVYTDISYLEEQFQAVFSGDVHEGLLDRYEALLFRYNIDKAEDIESVENYETGYELKEVLDVRESVSHLNEMGIQNIGDFIRFAFPHYLKSVGLPEMAALIENADTLQTVGDSLQYMDLHSELFEEEKAVRAAIKTSSPDERIELSKRIKEIERIKKKRAQIKSGLIDYFNAPQLYVDICQKKIRDVQEVLVGKQTGSTSSIRHSFDARDNADLDRDPGIISGDCTAGKPLLFDIPGLPLYNIKVFNDLDNQRHVGNMYLYVTNATEEGEQVKVWHLDAVQVPRKDIKWSESIGLIFEALSEQAKAHDVKAITLNSQIHEISNYDYIVEAVSDYWISQGRQITTVDIPKYKMDGRSDLQGDGEAIVVWSDNIEFRETEGELEGNADLFNPNGEPLDWNI